MRSKFATGWLRVLLCIAIAMLPVTGEAAKKKKLKPPVKAKAVTAPALAGPPLTEPPALDDFKARIDWATREADGFRVVLSNSPKDETARVLLASLAVVVTSDLERALSIGDSDDAALFRKLVERKLPDTRWRLGWIGRQGAGGGFYALGVMALHGILGPKDPEVACSLFTSAWEKGFLDAGYRLSECLSETDPGRAASLLRAAADSGHAMATEQLGRRCLETPPQDAKCAFTYVSNAAQAGRATAKSLLGWMYAQGTGVSADPARALALYLEAAASGDLSAKNNLGELYETGRGVPVDTSKAAGLYGEAAELGFAPAQFNLGRLYAAGTGVPRDADQARVWLRSALKAGVAPAQKLLDWLDAQPKT